ncbi:hypothetical protein LGN24_25645 [Burkholderia seminalis]|uniref:hypothetical protein n=1 Tax=Burkholderia seminalis TaxID=488731 RepID=UPI001CF2FC0A|nr:hypothetical protein [Burkholderia seminalis]MCA8304871.1 hypothetical protein [Burkholderia seminalis]
MCNLFRSAAGIVCLGLAASVFAQMADDPTENGANCRAIVAQADIDGTRQQIVGRACLQGDGTWQIVQGPDGSVLWYPAAAYPYADPWYWGPPLFVGAGVSFIFVDRFRRFHRFDHADHFNPIEHRRFGAPMGAGFRHGSFPVGATRGSGGMRRH